MKRTPLTRKTPLRSNKSIARSAIKRKAKPRAPKLERLHMSLVATMPCLICGGWPVEVHHVHSDGMRRLTRSNKRVVPLCSIAHRAGKFAVHALGHAAFNERNGIDLLAISERLWREFESRCE